MEIEKGKTYLLTRKGPDPDEPPFTMYVLHVINHDNKINVVYTTTRKEMMTLDHIHSRYTYEELPDNENVVGGGKRRNSRKSKRRVRKTRRLNRRRTKK